MLGDQSPGEVVAVYSYGIRLTDADTARLAGLTKLRDLNLGLTQTTDAGLGHLARLTNLKSLYHRHHIDRCIRCGRVHGEAVRELNGRHHAIKFVAFDIPTSRKSNAIPTLRPNHCNARPDFPPLHAEFDLPT